MEREAFRQRMQQYKQARESNPQLKYWDWKKENDLGYQLYKNNLPSNLQVETDDYDLYGAYESNMQPELNEDGTYHLGSRDPYTGRILKSKQHPTYQKAIESEISAGYFPYEKNNITYTKTYSPVDISGYADGGIIDEDPPQKLKYWDWKSTVQREPLDGVYEDARFIDQSEPRFELRKGQQYYASPNNLKLMKVLGKTVKVLGPIGEVVQNLFPSEEAEILEDARYKYENALKPKVYADGGEVRDNTYVAPVYKEQVFIPATGAQKIKNDYQYKYGSKSPYKGGELEIVSPEFDALTGIRGMLNSLSKINTLTKELNKNIDISTLNNQLPNNIGWGPKQSIKVIHDSNQNTSLNLYNTNRWDVVYEGANPHGIWFQGKFGNPRTTANTSIPGKSEKAAKARKLFEERPYRHKGELVLEKPLVTVGDVPDRSFLSYFGDKIGADGIIYNNVYDNGYSNNQVILSFKHLNDYNITNKYADGGIIDEDPPQNTSERPITNFDPKGDPYNPTYGYNPGAGYVRSVFDLYDAPVIGDALSIYDATQALKNKDWLGAGLAALTVVPFIPTVSNYKKSLNQQLNRITGITPHISKLQKQSDWNDLRNRSIERLYDPEVRARAAKIKSDYNVDLQSTYDKIINQYENDYFSLPEAEIMQLQDAKAMIDLQEEAARRYKQYGIKPTQKDFRIKIDNAVTPSQEITNHEINHFNQYIHQDSPSWNKSELDKITKQFKGKLRDKNPIDPENTSYFMNWMEQNAYGINMLDRLKELNIKPTKQNILKYLKSLPDTDSIKKAALQFKNLDDYIKWLNTMPLADNGNINEIENYNFA